MLKFVRNKVVSILKKDEATLMAHGILEDDIYGLEIDVAIGIDDLEIKSIEGKWIRTENSECYRALPFLQEAVGSRIEEGFAQRIQKSVGRKACRHFADILIESCDAARDAALLIRWEKQRKEEPDLTLNGFRDEASAEGMSTVTSPSPGSKVEKAGSERPKSLEERGERKEGGVIIDLHVHTSPASPCSSVSVEEVIEEAKRIGLDGICLTDHNHVWGAESVKALRERHGFLILRGNEITTDQGDMLVFGFERAVDGIIKLEQLKGEVSEARGFIIAAHPFRGFLTFGIGKLGLTPEKAMEREMFRHVDGVEVLNSKVTAKENSFAREVAAGLGLPGTGGSDAHEVSEVGIYATRFPDGIRDERDLVEALKRGNYEPLAFKKEREKKTRCY
jgi:predicted metal-dependent phosphoesterase TrpH